MNISTPAASASPTVPPGLKGVIVADTAVGSVRGEEGFYHYRQYSAPELAATCTLEDVWHLVLFGGLPTDDERRRLRAAIDAGRHLDPAMLPRLAMIAQASPTLTGALRTALSLQVAAWDLPPLMDIGHDVRRADVIRIAAVVPTLIATLARLRAGEPIVDPNVELGLAADYLAMVTGHAPGAAEARALEQYLILGIDHGFNASTFTGRVIASTGSDLGSAMVGALGSLLGPRHGGAPSRALDTLEAIDPVANTAAWVDQTIDAGDRIMGFGHPVYRTTDPRSTMLRGIAEALGGDRVAHAIAVEDAITRRLAERKPDQTLLANVEWYAAIVMDRCGLHRDLFTPTFAAGRVIGWGAHMLEQANDPRIIRPNSRYVGPAAPMPVPHASLPWGATHRA